VNFCVPCLYKIKTERLNNKICANKGVTLFLCTYLKIMKNTVKEKAMLKSDIKVEKAGEVTTVTCSQKANAIFNYLKSKAKEGQRVLSFVKTDVEIKSDLASVHNNPGKIEEVTTEGEFGLLIEDMWGSTYIGPFTKKEDAIDLKDSVLGWAPVGTAVHLVSDQASWRKTFADDSEE